MSEDEILKKLNDILGLKIDLKKPILYNLNPTSKFKWKAKYDQIPISTKSAITIISEISKHFPAKLNFIFIGDDDFISIPLNIALQIPTFSLDKDDEVLEEVEKLSKKFNVSINTIKADVRKIKNIGNFFGCYMNPPYNLPGSTSFLRFSSKILSKDGGIVFLVLGDDALGKRYVYLQKNISRFGFIIRKITPSKISYVFYPYHKEDRIIRKKMKKFGIELSGKETMIAALYVLELVGNVDKVFRDKDIYFYA